MGEPPNLGHLSEQDRGREVGHRRRRRRGLSAGGGLVAVDRKLGAARRQDRLFAQVNLDRHELDLYDQVYASMDINPPDPDLVVYVQAHVCTLLFRIANRGIDYEQRIGRHYLERLNEAYARFFHNYDSAPLLIVNAATIDPIHNDEHYNVLLEEICRIQRGRHFFNPIVSAMA
ncbi:MAG: deoxynucleoside kinase [Chloroflexi bacterium]|nr:deoxynucleoside kinase [Chloroflexota bacterium]